MDANDKNNINILKLHTRLIEQEHRFIQIAKDLYDYWSTKDDPRKRATYIALISEFILGGGKSVILGVVIALATVFYMKQQVDLLSSQNKLIEKELFEQLKQNNLQRVTYLTEILYAGTRENNKLSSHAVTKPNTHARIRAEALVEYVALRRLKASKNLQLLKTTNTIPTDSATLKFGVDLSWALLQGVEVQQANFSKIKV